MSGSPSRRVSVMVGILLILLSITQNPNTAPTQPRPQQSLALSVSHSAPDAQPQPQPLPVPPIQTKQPTEALITPWQGPVSAVPASPGLPPVLPKLPVTQPVVFLGIDDGWYQSPEILQWLKDQHLPFSLFVVDSQIKNNYDYFKQLQAAGMSIEDHSATHPDFTKLSLSDQQSQICNPASGYQTVFGQRPELFRPPYGAYNTLTQQASAACGIKAIITWSVVLTNGSLSYQAPATSLEPGDIILAHFQADLITNIQALNTELERDHLQLAHLEDWLQ